MSDEIYVNIGTSFQQPYQGQGLAQGRRPTIAQYIARQPANAQTPFTYQNRTPASARQPSSSQTPYIANRQIPSIIQATANYPYIASAQQNYPYIANKQTTIQVTGRSPVIYNATGRTPFTYSRQGQTPYSATGRTPFTYATQGQSPYSFQQSYQQPYERQAQQPYTFNATGQQPSIYQAQGQSPYSYQQNYRHPTIYTAQVNADYQKTYRHPVIYTHQVSVAYRHPSITQTTYRHPVIVQTTYRHPVSAQQPAETVGRQPTPYTYPDPVLLSIPYTSGQRVQYTYQYYGYANVPAFAGASGGSSPFTSWPSPFGGAAQIGMYMYQFPGTPSGTSWVVSIIGLPVPTPFSYVTFNVPGQSPISAPKPSMITPSPMAPGGGFFSFTVPTTDRLRYIQTQLGGSGYIQWF